MLLMRIAHAVRRLFLRTYIFIRYLQRGRLTVTCHCARSIFGKFNAPLEERRIPDIENHCLFGFEMSGAGGVLSNRI